MASLALYNEEILCNILSGLDCRELVSSQFCCKRWLMILSSLSASSLWKKIYSSLTNSLHHEEFKLGVSWRGKVLDIMPFLTLEPFSVKNVTYENNHLTCRAGHTANIVRCDGEDLILLFGGASHLFTYRNDCDLFSLTQNKRVGYKMFPLGLKSSPFSRCPTARWLHTSCNFHEELFNHESSIVIFGGETEQGCENDLFQLTVTKTPIHSERKDDENLKDDIDDNKYAIYSRRIPVGDGSNPIPSRRVGHIMVSYKNKYIIFGGMNSSRNVVNDTYILELIQDNPPAVSTSMTMPSNNMLTISPYNIPPNNSLQNNYNNNHSSQLQQSNTLVHPHLRASWKHIICAGAHPCPRYCHSGAVVGDELIVFGGWIYGSLPATRHVFLNDVWTLNLVTFTWVQINTQGDIPRPRCQSAWMPFDRKPVSYTASLINTEEEFLPHFNPLSPNSPGGSTGSSERAHSWSSPQEQGIAENKASSDQESRGILVLYGGACHSTFNPQPVLPYGDLVEDLSDFHVLDVDTWTWLPVDATYEPCRGGVNAVAKYAGGWILSGGISDHDKKYRGMHSDKSAHIPRFKNNVISIQATSTSFH